MTDVQAIITELERLPLRGTVQIRADYLRKLLRYIRELERKASA